MKLTSYERMRRYLASLNGDVLTDTANNKRDVEIWINAVSNNVEKYLNRELELKERTEYFDLQHGQKNVFPKAYPITSVSTCYYSSIGVYDDNESELVESDDFVISGDQNTLLLLYDYSKQDNAIKLTYTGGLATTGTKSTFSISTSSMDWSANNYCRGSTSNAFGLLTTATYNTVDIEVLYGSFSTSETLTQYTSEAMTTASATATLKSKTIESLCEKIPEIALATEMQTAYLYTRKNSIGFQSYQKDGSGNLQTVSKVGLLDECKMLLDKYMNL